MKHIPWIAMAIIGSIAIAVVAVSRGEPISALWIVVAAVCTFLLAYRYYALFIGRHVMQLDPARPTPKRHYYESHRTINPTGVVPVGPAPDFLKPHGREALVVRRSC